MYKNCIIINPKKKHCFTFLMLHPMCYSSEYFDSFITYFSKYYIFNNIKFIFPEAPLLNIDYPNNKLYNVPSWYNYYTCYDNCSKVDIINIEDFDKQCSRIIEIIKNEAFILNKFNKIFIIGVSQGGTLLFNILNKLPRNIGGLFCIKSIYMEKYIKLKKNKNTPIFIFSGNLDKVYNINFQKKNIRTIKKKKI